MEPSGGVDEEHVGVAAFGRGECIKDDGAGVGALLVGDDVGADDLAPRLELLDGSGAERVCSGDNDAIAFFAVGLRKFGDTGRLASAVYADDEDDIRARLGRWTLVAPNAAFLRAGLEDGNELFLEEIADGDRFLDLFLLNAELDVGEDLLRGVDPGVGANEELFELLPDLVVDLAAVEKAGDVAEPSLTGAFERLLGLLVSFLGAFEDAEQRGTSLSSAVF